MTCTSHEIVSLDPRANTLYIYSKVPLLDFNINFCFILRGCNIKLLPENFYEYTNAMNYQTLTQITIIKQ